MHRSWQFMLSSPSSKRLFVAFLLAPLAAPLTFIVAALGVQVVASGSPSARSAVDLVGAVLTVGTPPAYVATLALGVPLYFALRAFGLVRQWAVWLGGAAIGAVVSTVLASSLHADILSVRFPWWAGAVLGLVSAEVFWRVRSVPSSSCRDE